MAPLLRLPVLVPPFFLEACGYRGLARYVALRWLEDLDELWLTDDGHALRGLPGPMVTLWRREGGSDALDRFREQAGSGRTPYLVVDRHERRLFLGDALEVWRVVVAQCVGA